MADALRCPDIWVIPSIIVDLTDVRTPDARKVRYKKYVVDYSCQRDAWAKAL